MKRHDLLAGLVLASTLALGGAALAQTDEAPREAVDRMFGQQTPYGVGGTADDALPGESQPQPQEDMDEEPAAQPGIGGSAPIGGSEPIGDPETYGAEPGTRSQPGTGGSGPEGEAQNDAPKASPDSPSAPAVPELESLREEVRQLRQEVAALKGEDGKAIGGGGQAGQGEPSGSRSRTFEVSEGAAQPRAEEPLVGENRGEVAREFPARSGEPRRSSQADAEAATTDAAPQEGGTAVATVFFDGEVESVWEDRIVIREEDGTLTRLWVDAATRVRDEGRPVALEDLEQGSEVRVSFDLISGENVARSVVVQD